MEVVQILAHLRVPLLQTPPKFQRRPERELAKTVAGEGKKKREILATPTVRGSTIIGHRDLAKNGLAELDWSFFRRRRERKIMSFVQHTTLQKNRANPALKLTPRRGSGPPPPQPSRRGTISCRAPPALEW